jgi:hypothetical protein
LRESDPIPHFIVGKETQNRAKALTNNFARDAVFSGAKCTVRNRNLRAFRVFVVKYLALLR